MPLMGRRLKGRLAAAVLLVGGVALVLTGAWFGIANAHFIRHAARAPGTVIDIVGGRGARGSKMYYPVVRYRPRRDGAGIVFTAKPGLTWSSPFDVGERVTVAYNERDPKDAKIVSFWTLWLMPASLMLVGLGSLFAGRRTLAKAE
jgi:hypothetical protein